MLLDAARLEANSHEKQTAEGKNERGPKDQTIEQKKRKSLEKSSDSLAAVREVTFLTFSMQELEFMRTDQLTFARSRV